MARKNRIKTVLIIEDETEIRNFAARLLELEGYRVLTAANGERGMALIREHAVSLVLLDLRLPGRDGWSLLREIKNHPELAKIPVVVLSAIAEARERKKTLRMGASRYLIKPMSAHRLAQTVAGMLHRGSWGGDAAPYRDSDDVGRV